MNIRPRRVTLAGLGLALAFGAAACTGDDVVTGVAEQPAVEVEDSTPTSAEPVTPTVPSTPRSTYTPPVVTADDIEEQAYILSLDSQGVSYSSEANAISAGRSICSFLDTGAGDVYDAGIIAMDSGGYSADDAGWIVGSAVGAFCSEYEYQF